MTSKFPIWAKEWAVDRDPLARSQAWHLPTGLRFRIKDVGTTGRARHWVAIMHTTSRLLFDRLAGEMGFDDVKQWLQERQTDALQLWHLLGFDDPDSQPAAHADVPPCKLVSWRAQWETRSSGDQDDTTPDLQHVSGFAIKFGWAPRADGGTASWEPFDAPGCEVRNAAVKATCDSDTISRLYKEAFILRMEQGFFEDTRPISYATFGPDWRKNWGTEDGERGESWLLHASGWRVKPVFGQVEDDGMQAWTLYTHPNWRAFEGRMESRVGYRVCELLLDQAGLVGRELGLMPTLPAYGPIPVVPGGCARH